MIQPNTLLRIVLPLLMMLPAACLAEQKPSPQAAHPDVMRVYIGTFTWKDSKGIYLSRLNLETGALSSPELVAEGPSPSFLALHPNHRFIYSVNEMDSFAGKPGGAVTAFAMEPSGKLKQLNQEASAGGGPTHLTVDREGKNVIVANYGTGSVAVLPIGEDGKLAAAASVEQHKGAGTDADHPEQPHAHCANVDPSGHFVISADLGLDQLFVYRLDSTKGKIEPTDPATVHVAPDSGPRHLAFHPGGAFVYALTEAAGTIDAFKFDAEHGTLKPIQTIGTVARDFAGKKSSAEIVVHPSGKFLYATNRGEANNIAIFGIDQHSGLLTPISRTSTQGKAPRGLGIDPTGRWLIAANQDTNNVVVFQISATTGELTPVGVNLQVPTPVSVLFVQE